MTEQDNILPPEGPKENLSEDKLLAYLEGRLTPAAQHEVEQWLAGEGMESDAIEGLQAMNTGEVRHRVGRLNRSLRKSLHDKRTRKPLQSDYIVWAAIATVLLLAIAAYFVVRKSIR